MMAKNKTVMHHRIIPKRESVAREDNPQLRSNGCEVFNPVSACGFLCKATMSIQRVIKSVAVIGGGPAGITTINELLHTGQGGFSTLKTGARPQKCAFDKVVCFEQNSNWGGVWNYFEKPDPRLPLLQGNYSNPDTIFERSKLPAQSSLEKTSYGSPFEQVSSKKFEDETKWQRNAAYKDLFTNVPEKYMRFSYLDFSDLKINENIHPLVTADDIMKYLDDIVDKYSLKDHIRLNSSVENVEKLDDCWRLTIREKEFDSNSEKWYYEYFDAVVAANGHCSVPYIPQIPNLNEFNDKHPNVIQHSKSFRNSDDYLDGDVLLLGSGTSSIDLAQYILPKAKSITMSQRSASVYDWIRECFDQSPEIDFKPRIKQLLPETKQVEFVDGSIKSFDHIILGTGYHYHWPFLNQKEEIVKVFNEPTSTNPVNKIGNLYMYVFSVVDNTFATVGIPTLNLMFHNMEYGALAIAGVFSGAKKLPDLERQLEWDASRTQIEEPEVPHRFQGFPLDKLDEQLFDHLYSLAPIDRERPLVRGQCSQSEFDESNNALKNVYLSLKSGKVKECDILANK